MDLQYVFMVMATVLVGIYSVEMDDNVNITIRTYCGKHLSQALSAVCKGNYNTLNKKSDIYVRYTDAYGDSEHPFRSKATASALITNFRRRRRRGVYNECCQKPCTHEELSTYCGGNDRR